MGRMYWQTNDIWQGASWAAVDYTGRYKMVQYFTTHFYAPFLVSAAGSAVHGTFELAVINDDAFGAALAQEGIAAKRGLPSVWTFCPPLDITAEEVEAQVRPALMRAAISVL